MILEKVKIEKSMNKKHHQHFIKMNSTEIALIYAPHDHINDIEVALER